MNITTPATKGKPMTAVEVIALIRADSPGATTDQIRDALEDGAALAALGITDEHTEAVEEAHASLA